MPKRVLSKQEKSMLVDLIINGYSRTAIAKKMKIKNLTLEKICQENNIDLNHKYCSAFIKYDTSGIVTIKNRNIYFSNLSQLYLLLMFSKCSDITNIMPYDNTYKIIKNNNIQICPIDNNIKATNEMIKNAVEKRIIKFMNPYYNHKFGIN